MLWIRGAPLMATMNVSLPDPLKAWADAQVESGRYASTSDYLRDLIRKDQDRSAKIGALQRLIDDGLASGDAQSFDLPAFLAEMSAKHGRRA
jgi:antitoxin ParD1/3/4